MSEAIEKIDNSNLKFITLLSSRQCFCIDIKAIREIRRWSPVTELPHSPEHVLGVMNLRGAVIPIVDLSSVLGFGPTDPTSRHVTIIVSLNGRVNGLLVDSVSEILSAIPEDIQETPRIRDDEKNSCIEGIIALDEDITRIIDLSMLLTDTEQVAA